MTTPQFRILFVLTPALHPNEGGVQMSTCKLGRHFLKLGHDVSVFSFASSGHSESEPMRLLCADCPGAHHTAVNLQQLERVIEELQPDVVINQMPYEHQIGRVLRHNKSYLLLGCLRNTLYSVRGNIETYAARTAPRLLKRYAGSAPLQQFLLGLHRRRHRAELIRILDTYDHFLLFGRPNLEELAWFVPEFDPGKIRLIPNSIPKVAHTPPPKEKRLLWLGRVAHEQKRAELILPIWQKVSEALPDWRLDVVGDGPLLKDLKRKAGDHSLRRIQFHGRQIPDDYYRRSAIFFMTSAFEGFPNTLVEAQSQAAVPVIFDSYPVARWIVRDGIDGALLPPFDTNAMADRIVELAKNPDRRQLAEQALESARRFHIDRVGGMWQALFEAEVPRHAQPRYDADPVS